MGESTPYSESSASRFGTRGSNEKNHRMGTNHHKLAFDYKFTTLKFVMTPWFSIEISSIRKALKLACLYVISLVRNGDKRMVTFIIWNLEAFNY